MFAPLEMEKNFAYSMNFPSKKYTYFGKM
jgi:hypothetical protein